MLEVNSLSLWAHHQADNRFVFREFITTNSAQDNGTIPMMIYRAEIRNSLNLGAPNGSGDFPGVQLHQM